MSIDYRKLLYLTIRKMWLLLILALIGSGIFFVKVNRNYKPVYETSSILMFTTEQYTYSYKTLSEMSTNRLLMPTYMGIASSNNVMQELSDALPYHPPSFVLQRLIMVGAHEEADTIKVVVRGVDPEAITDICNTYCRVFIDKIEELLHMNNLEVLDVASVPTEPLPSGIVSETVKGGILGLILYGIIITYMFYNDQKVKSKDDVARLLNLRVIGTLPVHD